MSENDIGNQSMMIARNKVVRIDPRRSNRYKKGHYINEKFFEEQNIVEQEESETPYKDTELFEPIDATLPLPVKKVSTYRIYKEPAFRNEVKFLQPPSKVPGFIGAVLMLSLAATLVWKAHKYNPMSLDNQNTRD